MQPTSDSPGLFSKLISELKKLSLTDANIADRLRDFEEALRDLKIDHEPRRIRNCVQTQMNLLEAIACKHPGIRGRPWVRCASSSLHGRTLPLVARYPAYTDSLPISQACVTESASKGFKREVDMRDLVSLSIILAGFTPYLTDLINSEHIYSD